MSPRAGDPAPPPPPLRPESEIVAGWEGERPLVSVLCPTYQHREFVAEAIHGVLGQRTSFPFELLVRDDASTDGTAEVVSDYAARYPAIIRPVLESENRWPQRKAAFVLAPLARGDFIAFCEGDDYWTDPLKLERQVRALEERPEAVVAHHQAAIVEDGIVVEPELLPESDARALSAADLRRGAWLPTPSLCYRNVPIPEPPMAHRIVALDRFHAAALGAHGEALYLPEIEPAVYRRHPGGAWSGLGRLDLHMRMVESDFWIAAWLREEGDSEAALDLLRRCVEMIAATHPGAAADIRLAYEQEEPAPEEPEEPEPEPPPPPAAPPAPPTPPLVARLARLTRRISPRAHARLARAYRRARRGVRRRRAGRDGTPRPE